MPQVPPSDSRLGALTPRTLFLGGIMVALLGTFTAAVEDPDFWWHLRVGRWMLDNRQLPSQDLFTYTASGHVWTDHEYLAEVLIWLLYQAGGFVAISVAFGLLTWAGFLLIYRSARGGRQPYLIAGLGLALAALAGGPIWGPRAQMITFFFSCLELMWLAAYLEGRSRAINWFPLVMVLWANLHGGWAVGFGFLGIAIASELVHLALDRESPVHRAHLRRLGLITIASVAAVAATPHGLGLYLYPFQTQGSAAQQRLIVEWFSPDFHQLAQRPFELYLMLLVVGFSLRRPSFYQMLLTLATLALALQSVRHVALFVAATAPILIVTWSEVWRDVSARRGWKLGGVSRARPQMAVLVSVALLVIGGATFVRVGSQLSQQDAFVQKDYPVAASNWLAAHPEVGTRMYNQYGWGGYLSNRFYPDPNRQVFIFGEAALMGDDLLQQYQDVQTIRPNWGRVLDAHGIDYVIYNRDGALSDVLVNDPRWKLVYEDDTAMIFVRVR